MPLFNLFDGDARQREEELSQNQDLDIYTGMKVECLPERQSYPALQNIRRSWPPVYPG